jgi:hypothetical protein
LIAADVESMPNAVNKAEVALIAAEFGTERRGEVTGEVEGGGRRSQVRG